MFKSLLKRMMSIVPSLFVVITLSFFITRFAPGSPFSTEGMTNAAIIENLNRKYGLDQPLHVQYFRYISGLLVGDFGPSLRYPDRSVTQIIAESLPVSLSLGLMALGLALVMGILMGVLSAIKQNTWIDYACSGLAITGISLPLFVIAPVLVLVFSMGLRWLPTSGWFGEGANRMILPVIALSFPYFAIITRLMRSSMLEVLRSDYIRTARAKGLSTATIILKHALRGALLPVVSYLGPALANIITGSLIVEQIFRIPGLARPFVQSALNRDYTLIMGCVITYAVLLMIMNLIVDILYTVLDPRISYS
ncbi:MAG: ABC transporter permease [Spirochaetia bacterium]